ncbi:MAG: hypothetical protein HY697_04565 [Deltaproteobacteria bacterium]|nr:hypothetical protein [Deltaproteobacteria bacterium]
MIRRTFLIIAVLIVAAFVAGYLVEYLKLREAEKRWRAAQEESQARIAQLEKDLLLARARLSLWEMPLVLSQVIQHLSQNNFGLAVQTLDRLKENFSATQAALAEEGRGKFDFLLPALEEIRQKAQALSPEARTQTEELKARMEQVLRSPASG